MWYGCGQGGPDEALFEEQPLMAWPLRQGGPGEALLEEQPPMAWPLLHRPGEALLEEQPPLAWPLGGRGLLGGSATPCPLLPPPRRLVRGLRELGQFGVQTQADGLWGVWHV